MSRPVEVPKISIRDQQVIYWIEDTYFKDQKVKMPPGISNRILFGIRASCSKLPYRLRGLVENVRLAQCWRETRMNWQAVGMFDKLPPEKRSEGLSQICRDIAESILHRKLGPRELLDNIELNTLLGTWYLLKHKTLQNYNAGEGGAQRGLGVRYSRSVKQTLQGLPWRVKFNKGAVNEKLYGALFHVIDRSLVAGIK